MKSGEERTTIKSSCGFSAVGNPREARGKLKIHVRHCEACKLANYDVAEFKSTSGSYNNISVSKRGHQIIKYAPIIKYSGDESSEITHKEYNQL